jgi:hypothetical protein
MYNTDNKSGHWTISIASINVNNYEKSYLLILSMNVILIIYSISEQAIIP